MQMCGMSKWTVLGNTGRHSVTYRSVSTKIGGGVQIAVPKRGFVEISVLQPFKHRRPKYVSPIVSKGVSLRESNAAESTNSEKAARVFEREYLKRCLFLIDRTGRETAYSSQPVTLTATVTSTTGTVNSGTVIFSIPRRGHDEPRATPRAASLPLSLGFPPIPSLASAAGTLCAQDDLGKIYVRSRSSH